jgi:hypothetical protein
MIRGDGPRVHSDALGAYRALAKVGGLEPAGRDQDLVGMLIERISPGAPDIVTALNGTSVSMFLSAMLSAVQPFTAMFRDVLAFFERAKAHYGQAQWRLAVGDEFPELARSAEQFGDKGVGVICHLVSRVRHCESAVSIQG